MENLKIFNYEGSGVTFKHANGYLMVNATEMCKPFGKLTKDFLINDRTKAFIDELTVRGNLPTGEMIDIKQGGTEQGTWLHEKIALKLAAWLSPKFELWIYDRIHELLTIGMTAMPQTLENLVNNPDLLIQLATQLKEMREQQAIASQKITELTPKAEFYDTVTASTDTIDMGQVAKILNMGIGRNQLFELLREKKVLKENNEPYQKYVSANYFKVVETKYDNKGTTMIGTKTVVYQKGLDYIRKLI
jgi:phage antirepressor YoqD-like protein